LWSRRSRVRVPSLTLVEVPANERLCIESATVAEVAKASGYSKRNVQEALTSLAAAGAATLASNGSEQRFAVDRSRWGASAGSRASRTPDLPRLADLLGSAAPDSALAQAAEPEALSDYLRASQAGDLLDVVRPELSRAGVLMPARLGGERTWTDLQKTIEYALSWLAPGSGASGRPGVCSTSCRTCLRAIGGD
jgi:hypothetical protein